MRDASARPERKFRVHSFPLAILCILLGMLVSFLVLGFWAPYWHKAVSNLLSVYEALLYNDRLAQEFLEYPGYLSPQLLGLWYRGLHFVGLLPQYRFADVANISTTPLFDATWQNLVAWGRIYAFALGAAYVTLATVLIRRLIGNWQVATLAGIALAFSDGIALAYRMLRSDLLASGLVFIALLLTLIAAREGPSARRFVQLGLAALLVALAMTEKVQALLPALTIPVIALAFGRDERDTGTPAAPQSAWLRFALLCVIGLALIAPTIGLIDQGIAGMAGSTLLHYRPVFPDDPGLYQGLLVAYVAICMAIYAALWRVRPLDAISALLVVLVGLALGLLALYARYDLNAVIAVANPIEHLHAASATPNTQLPTTSIVTLGGKFLLGLGKALGAHTFLPPTHRPTLLIEWLAIYAAWINWRRGDKQVAAQIAVLLLAAFAVDASFTLRGTAALKVYYTPYTDPFIVLAGAIALNQFADELTGLRSRRLILAFLLLYVIWGNFESARATYGGHRKAKVCRVAAPLVQRLTIPYCAKAETPLPHRGGT
jgi:hypothetical protein